MQETIALSSLLNFMGSYTFTHIFKKIGEGEGNRISSLSSKLALLIPSAEITGKHHHGHFMWYWEWNSGFCVS